MSNETRTVGLSIPARPEPAKFIRAKISTRPLRTVVFLPENCSAGWVRVVVQYLTSIYGGCYNLIMPVRDGLLEEYWLETLLNFNPEIVLYAGDYPQNVHAGRWRRLSFDSRLIDDFNSQDQLDMCGNVTMRKVFVAAYREQRNPEQQTIRYWGESSDCSVGMCGTLWTGIPSNPLEKRLKKLWDTQTLSCKCSLKSYLAWLTEISEEHFHPLNYNSYELGHRKGADFGGLCFVFIDMSSPEWREQVCRFWNLRAMFGGPGFSAVYPIPGNLDWEKAAPDIMDWASKVPIHTNAFSLVSSHDEKKLNEIGDLLLSQEGHRFDNFAICQPGRFQTFRVANFEKNVTVRIENNRISGTIPEPFWDSSSSSSRLSEGWIAEISLKSISRVYPRNSLLSNLDSVPYSKDQYLLANVGERDFFEAEIPCFQKSVFSLFERFGGEARLTDKAKYTNGILTLCGGYKQAMWLLDTPVQLILKRLCYKNSSNPQTYNQLRSLQSEVPESEKKTFPTFLEEVLPRLLHANLVNQGYEVRCPACDLKSFFKLESFREDSTIKCLGCGQEQRPAIRAELSYAPNYLVVRAQEQGVFPLLFAIRAFKGVACLDGFDFLPGLEVTLGGLKTDIDLVVVIGGEVIFCEAKTLESGGSEDTLQKVGVQLDELLKLATITQIRAVVLTSLMAKESKFLTSELDTLRNKYPHIGLSHACLPHLDDKTVPFLVEYENRGFKRDRPTTVDLLVKPRSGSWNLKMKHPDIGLFVSV